MKKYEMIIGKAFTGMPVEEDGMDDYIRCQLGLPLGQLRYYPDICRLDVSEDVLDFKVSKRNRDGSYILKIRTKSGEHTLGSVFFSMFNQEDSEEEIERIKVKDRRKG